MTGITRESFLQSFVPQDVAIRKIEVIGEATRRIQAADASFMEANKDLGLHEAIRMRNRIAHQYEGVDLELVWQVATTTVPYPRL